MEMASMIVIAVFYSLLLLLIEYRIFVRLWGFATSSLAEADKPAPDTLQPGSEMEKRNVIEKLAEIKNSKKGSKLFFFLRNCKNKSYS